jgi:thiol:disulfide interchange protein
VLVDITADWCTICKALERKVFPTRAFIDAAKPFTTLSVDVSTGGHPNFPDRFDDVTGPPAFIFYDAEGTRVLTPEIRQLPEELEHITPERFAEILRNAAAHIEKGD